jgi:hypothetical protein
MCEGAQAAWDYLSWVDVVPESRWEISDLLAEELVSPAVADQLLLLADDPIHVTLAPPEALRAAADLWSGEAVALIGSAKQEGWFESLAAVAREGGLTPPELRRLRLVAREPLWTAAALTSTRAVTGDLRAEGELDPNGRTDPLGSLRARAELWGIYRLGVLATEEEEDGPALRKYYVGAEPSDALLRRAVVGTYRASFGEGLVLSNYRRGAHGIFYDTIHRRKYRGVAATSGVGRVEWTVLYSEEERETDDELEQVIASNLDGNLSTRWRAGVTFCRTDDRGEPALPGQPRGGGSSVVDNLGAYWRGGSGHWHTTGELAATLDGGAGAYAELQRNTGPVRVRASARHYASDFETPQGMPFADNAGTAAQGDESGFYVEAKTGARGWYGLRASCDVWGTASLDNLRGEITTEAAVWKRGWELSCRILHREDDPAGGGATTAFSSRARREWPRVAVQAYGRTSQPAGLGHVEPSVALRIAGDVRLSARGKIDLGRRVGGTSWQELLLTGGLWGKLRLRVGHRLGWERKAHGKHARQQVLRAELNALF